MSEAAGLWIRAANAAAGILAVAGVCTLVWFLTRGRHDEIATLSGHEDGAFCLVLSPDGTRIASGGGDGDVRIWDVATLKPKFVLKGHVGRVLSLTWSADGGTLASGSEDGSVRLWDPSTGAKNRFIRTCPGPFRRWPSAATARGAAILNRLEQDNLSNLIDLNSSMPTTTAQTITPTPVKIFVCPSDPGPTNFQVRDHYGLPLEVVARANYVGMFGFGEPTDDTGNGEGIFFCLSKVRIADITDGTSNTFAIGERASTLAMATWTEAVPNGTVKNLSHVPGSVDGEAGVFTYG